MKYKITAKAGGRQISKQVASVKALHANLASLRYLGYNITDISRVRSSVVR